LALDLFAGRQVAACQAYRGGRFRGHIVPCLAGSIFAPDLLARPAAMRRSGRPISPWSHSDRGGDRACSLYRIRRSTACAYLRCLVLLIASVGCHHCAARFWALVVFFRRGGPAAARPIADTAFSVGPLRFTPGQSIAVYAITIAFIIGLWLFFFRLHALRQGAARHRRQPPRPPRAWFGIRGPRLSGTDRFPSWASVIGAISGILIGADHDRCITTTGFLIGLKKGFICRDHRRARQLSP